MIDIKRKEDCCGCNACGDACAHGAITFKTDNEGFWYPEVDKEKCVDCGLCEKVCPVIQKPTLGSFSEASFAAYSKNEQIRKCSSSGGVFSVLAQIVLKHNGVVFGAAFDDEWNVHHIIIDKLNDIHKLRGSKYVQSSTEYTFTEIQSFLKKEKMVQIILLYF